MSYPAKSKKVLYVVFHGRIVGIHDSWQSCYDSVHGFARAKYKGYEVAEDAFEAWERFEETGKADVRAPATKQRGYTKPDSQRSWNKDKTFVKPKERKLVPLNAYIAKHEVAHGAGSFQHTCTALSCTYPRCGCIDRG